MENTKQNEIKNWIQSTFIAISILAIFAAITILFNYYILDSVIVMGNSMHPTYNNYDKVYISRINRVFGFKPEREKIISFEEPLNDGKISNENPIAIYNYKTRISFWNYFKPKTNECIKRIIGLPGEHVEIKNGKIYINDQELEENYLPLETYTEQSRLFDFTVPEDTVFVLGDNREHSEDSRGFGCIPFERIDVIAY